MNLITNTSILKKEILIYFDNLEIERLRLINKLNQFSNEQLNFHLPKEWSILQILEHLRVAEKQSLKVILKPDIDNQNKITFFQRLKLSFYIFLLKIGFKFIAPLHVSRLPENLDLEILNKKWNENRKEWNDFLFNFDKNISELAIFPHPILGYLSLKMTLEFIFSHQTHHFKKINIILNSFSKLKQ